MDRIDCLRAFVRAMEGGSFSAAAKELGIGQPAVSKRIAMLEEEFGSQLFMRTTRKLTPTPRGASDLRSRAQMLGTFEMARASIEEAPARPSGTLCVERAVLVRPPLPDADHRGICAEFPEVRVDLVSASDRQSGRGRHRTGAAHRPARVEFADGAADRHRAALSGRDPDLSARAAAAAHTRRPEAAPMHRLFTASPPPPMDVRIRTRPSCRGDPGSVTVDDADAMQEAVLSISASRSCRRGMRSVAFAAASWSLCCRTIPSPHCRCMRSIRRPTGCRCARAASWISLVERADRLTARP